MPVLSRPGGRTRDGSSVSGPSGEFTGDHSPPGGQGTFWAPMKRRDPSPGASAPPTIEGYTDLQRIGDGGFSVVYRAHELALHRQVAVKVLAAGMHDQADRTMFERECRALGQLDHPDIVRVYRSAFTADDRPCIVMELYETTFRKLLDEHGPLAAPVLLDVGVRIAVALHVAHSRGVLHRDVKPHNIFRSRYGDPALGDFGISTVIGERTHSAPAALSVAYAAPELLDDGPVGPAADIYGLAATLHHLATGSPPFAAKDLRQTVAKVLNDDPPPIERGDLPTGFGRVIRAGLAKSPEQRPPTALAFAEMLGEVQARAGFPRTALKLELADQPVDAPADLPIAIHVDRPPVVDLAAAPATLPPPAGDDGGSVSEHTVVRQRPTGPEVEEAEQAAPNRMRTWIAALIALVAVAGLVVGIIVATRGDEKSADNTTSTTIAPPDTFYETIAAPAAATVTSSSAEPGVWLVDITPVEGAARYMITVVGLDQPPIGVAADQLPAKVTSPDTPRLCVLVSAVGPNGRVSPTSPPFCSA